MMIDFKQIQLTERTMLSMIVLLSVSTLIMFFYASWQWRNDWIIAHQEIVNTSLSTIDDTQEMIASIPKAHLFGQSFTNGEVPISSLQLRVTGIVKIDPEQEDNKSKAYISIQGQPSKIYEKGDDLPYGVKVYDITSDAVILENNGHLEKLPLPREKLEFKPFQPKESQ
ncbi:MAG: hypothetical protein ACD_46C00246G0006 [uncultured bacterium]|nr:MAG: hypothetical protein ACD_46C00246G0006 [uncultured bacterium]